MRAELLHMTAINDTLTAAKRLSHRLVLRKLFEEVTKQVLSPCGLLDERVSFHYCLSLCAILDRDRQSQRNRFSANAGNIDPSVLLRLMEAHEHSGSVWSAAASVLRDTVYAVSFQFLTATASACLGKEAIAYVCIAWRCLTPCSRTWIKRGALKMRERCSCNTLSVCCRCT